MDEKVTISREEYEFLKRKASEAMEMDPMTKFAMSSFAEAWSSKEDEVWDKY